jgi:acid phosphatase type 7
LEPGRRPARAARGLGPLTARRWALIAAFAGLTLAGVAPAEAARSARLVAAGDIACHERYATRPDRCRYAYTAELVKTLDPDVVATLGDAHNGIPTLAHYLGSYDPTWGAFRSITRPALGNHEYLASDDRRHAPGHFRYFGRRAGPRRGYYTYRLAGWRVVVLNSGALDFARNSRGLRNDCYPVSCARRSRQVRWLRRLMARLTPNRCVIAYWHHARYSSANPGPSRELRHAYEALYQGGAELALVGHSHSYERFAPMDWRGRPQRHGVRQFVVGTGGADRAKRPRRRDRGSQFFDRSLAFGVLELTLRQGSYRYRFVREDGATLDRGGGRCHRRPAAKPRTRKS